MAALAACGGAKTSPSPAVGNAAPLPARATPAPNVAWNDTEHRFVVDGLPAAARDGRVALVAIEGGDGGRGYPNMRIELRDRDDRVLETLTVISANDWERLAPDGKPGRELELRLGDMGHRLVTLHAQYDLVHLDALQVMKGGDEPHLATDGNLWVEWVGDSVHVIRKPAPDARDQRLAHKGDPSWLVPASGHCENPAYLGGAYHIDGVDLVVVDVRYRGSDSCWEPADQWHVVAW
jgi:hypothetical protein